MTDNDNGKNMITERTYVAHNAIRYCKYKDVNSIRRLMSSFLAVDILIKFLIRVDRLYWIFTFLLIIYKLLLHLFLVSLLSDCLLLLLPTLE